MGDHHQQHHHLFPSHFAYDPSANILGLVISLNVGNYVQCGSQIDTNGERSICIMRRLDTEPSQLGARFSRVFRILRDISSKTLQPVFLILQKIAPLLPRFISFALAYVHNYIRVIHRTATSQHPEAQEVKQKKSHDQQVLVAALTGGLSMVIQGIFAQLQ